MWTERFRALSESPTISRVHGAVAEALRQFKIRAFERTIAVAELVDDGIRLSIVKVRGSEALIEQQSEAIPVAGVTGALLQSSLNSLMPAANRKQLRLVLSCPRRRLIVRHLTIPNVSTRTIREAINLQAELTKPSDGRFLSASIVQRANGRADLTIASVPEEWILQLIERFKEAGYPVSSVIVPQFALLNVLLRSPGVSKTERLLVLKRSEREIELATLERGAVVSTRSLQRDGTSSQILRETRNTLANLRWDEVDEIISVGGIEDDLLRELAGRASLSTLDQKVDAFREQPEPVVDVLACALTGLQWRPKFSMNLLPKELRVEVRHLYRIPAYALVAINLVLLIALGLRSPVEQHWLLRKYQAELARIQATAKQSEVQKADEKRIREQLQTLMAFKSEGVLPASALAELARRLPNDTWLNQFTYEKGRVEISGSSKSAAAILPLLQSCPNFEDIKFIGAISKDSAGQEIFRMSMRVKGRL